MTAPLPASPDLEQLRRRARELLRAVRTRQPAALARVRQVFPEPPAPFTLAHAQCVIAREHGHPSWPKLKAYVERVTGRPGALRAFRREIAYYEERAAGLLSVRESGLPNALEVIRRFHPGLEGASDAAIRSAPFTLADARLVLAREHGFDTWEQFRRHIADLEKGESAEPFMDAFDALDALDSERLRELLEREPGLLHARGTNGNSMLGLALGAMMSRDYSRAPAATDQLAEARKILLFLLERGAGVNAPNDRGWTPMHDAAYCGHAPMVRALLGAGGRVDLSAHGEGGTPLAVALFWGHSEAAELLAERGIVPANLRVAAGLGRVELIRELFQEDGSLKPEAGQARAFYRPHTGFPVWSQRNDRREILDEALVWAAHNARVEAMAELVRRGADVNGCPYRGTPLIWAAYRNHVEAVEWLLDHGADVNRRTVFGGTQHGQGVTALHLAAQNGKLETCRLLCERGADGTVVDDLYHSPPWGWAAHFGETAAADLILEHAWPHSVFAAVATGAAERVRQAVGAHPEQVNDDRAWATPLGLAAAKGLEEIAGLLLEAGADPNRPGRAGKRPLEHAAEGGGAAMMELLRRSGAEG